MTAPRGLMRTRTAAAALLAVALAVAFAAAPAQSQQPATQNDTRAADAAARAKAAAAQAKAAAAEAKASSAGAKSSQGAAGLNPFGEFKTNTKAPIDIESDTIELFDQKKLAVFRGNVKVVQGDFELRTVVLEVHYEGGADSKGGAAGTGAQRKSTAGGAMPGGDAGQIKRINARDKVVIKGREGQTATGDQAEYDVKQQTALLTGNVVVTRDRNVVKGDRLLINLRTGEYRFLEQPPDGAAKPGEVSRKRQQAVFYPGDAKKAQQNEGAKGGEPAGADPQAGNGARKKEKSASGQPGSQSTGPASPSPAQSSSWSSTTTAPTAPGQR